MTSAWQFVLELGLTHTNGWDHDAQNVEFNEKCTPPRSRVLHRVITYLFKWKNKKTFSKKNKK